MARIFLFAYINNMLLATFRSAQLGLKLMDVIAGTVTELQGTNKIVLQDDEHRLRLVRGSVLFVQHIEIQRVYFVNTTRNCSLRGSALSASDE